MSQHERQEREANRFSVCLLLPHYRLKPYLGDDADLAKVVDIATTFRCSKESSARRYGELLEVPNAVLFSKGDRLRYSIRNGDIGVLDIVSGQRVPDLPAATERNGLSEIEEVNSVGWLRSPHEQMLSIQTLHQRDGFAITLLTVQDAGDGSDSEDNDGLDDTFERFNRF